MDLLRDEIEQIRGKIEMVNDLFYQQKDKEGYQMMEKVIPELSNVIDHIFLYKKQDSKFEIDEQRLIRSLTEAMNAMEEKDTILLADVLQYEFLDLMDAIKEELNTKSK